MFFLLSDFKGESKNNIPSLIFSERVFSPREKKIYYFLILIMTILGRFKTVKNVSHFYFAWAGSARWSEPFGHRNPTPTHCVVGWWHYKEKDHHQP